MLHSLIGSIISSPSPLALKEQALENKRQMEKLEAMEEMKKHEWLEVGELTKEAEKAREALYEEIYSIGTPTTWSAYATTTSTRISLGVVTPNDKHIRLQQIVVDAINTLPEDVKKQVIMALDKKLKETQYEF